MKKLYLAGGCFWCISDYFLMQDGVNEVNVGYSGGSNKDVTYEKVKAQLTGHRESIEIVYDEEQISLNKLLDYYFSYVDVLDEGGQGIDRGHSYSLALYYQNEDERQIFLAEKLKIEKQMNSKINVAIEPFKFFVTAEKEHQHFSFKNPERFKEELIASNHLDHLKAKEDK